MINKRIKEIRDSMGLTQEEFAKRLLVECNTVTRWEMDARNPNARIPTASHLLLIELVTGMKFEKED